ncbi:RNA-directed DNA polymerase, eukaryota, reverse transcriptase zinc-binding domain protein [Tanacetum coccineum]
MRNLHFDTLEVFSNGTVPTMNISQTASILLIIRVLLISTRVYNLEAITMRCCVALTSVETTRRLSAALTFSPTAVILNQQYTNSEVFNSQHGSNISFWRDPWCGNGSRLMDSFPRLYALDSFQDCTISDRWRVVDDVWGGNWEWRYPPRGRAISDVTDMLSLIGNLSLSSNGVDKWTWSQDNSGIFKVQTLSNNIQNLSLADCNLGVHHTWNSWIPRKVNICVWRASINRLPTRTNLISRGVFLASVLCPFCENEEEDIEHCLIRCPRVLPIWRKVWSWWHLPSPVTFPSFSITDIALGKLVTHDSPRLKKAIHGVFQSALWAVWKWRNKLINSPPEAINTIKEEDIFPSIQRLTKTWISARYSRPTSWNCWISSPTKVGGLEANELNIKGKINKEATAIFLLPKAGTPTRWIKLVPIKLNITAWRICLDKLPTRLNLSSRGLDIPTILCPLCNDSVESTSHIFFSCQLASQLMAKVCRWWELDYIPLNSYADWLFWLTNSRLSKLKKEIL